MDAGLLIGILIFFGVVIGLGVFSMWTNFTVGKYLNTDVAYDVSSLFVETNDKHILTIRLSIVAHIIDDIAILLSGKTVRNLLKSHIADVFKKRISQYDADYLLSEHPDTITAMLKADLEANMDSLGLELKRLRIEKFEPYIVDLIGKQGRTTSMLSPMGVVEVRGELWSAHAEDTIKKNTPIIVKEQDGLQLYVEPLADKQKFKKKKSL